MRIALMQVSQEGAEFPVYKELLSFEADLESVAKLMTYYDAEPMTIPVLSADGLRTYITEDDGDPAKYEWSKAWELSREMKEAKMI